MTQQTFIRQSNRESVEQGNAAGADARGTAIFEFQFLGRRIERQRQGKRVAGLNNTHELERIDAAEAPVRLEESSRQLDSPSNLYDTGKQSAAGEVPLKIMQFARYGDL